MIKYRVIAISETGAVRDNNEDNLYLNSEWRHGSEVNVPYWHYLDKTADASLFVVCDGMGGESYGEEASLIAVSGLSAVEDRLIHSSKQDFAELMQSYLLMVNQEICNRIRAHHGLRMGTTFSSLLIRHRTARCINLGDSRIYLYRRDKLRQLTVDQTQAQKLADLGLISQSEVKTHPEHNRLVQHLGIFPNEYNLEPALSPEIELAIGDCFLLCSDGLTDMLSDENIRKILSTSKDIKLAAEDLVQKAIIAGGKDNITVILLRIDNISDERLMKSGRIKTVAPTQAAVKTVLNLEDTRQNPLMKMRLNENLLHNFPAASMLDTGATGADGLADEVETEFKHLSKGISNFDLLQHPYLDFQKLEEQQALQEADKHEKQLLQEKMLQTQNNDRVKQHDTVVDTVVNMGENKGSNILISRVSGNNASASTLSFFDENRTLTEPITTDDLQRFNQAREAARRRQMAQQLKEKKPDGGKYISRNLPYVTQASPAQTKGNFSVIWRLILALLVVIGLAAFIYYLYRVYDFNVVLFLQDLFS